MSDNYNDPVAESAGLALPRANVDHNAPAGCAEGRSPLIVHFVGEKKPFDPREGNISGKRDGFGGQSNWSSRIESWGLGDKPRKQNRGCFQSEVESALYA